MDRSSYPTRLTPAGETLHAQALEVLQALQTQGHKVAMVGDGLNDGPVLAGADVSFALGQAVPLAQSKSDFVLMGGQLQVLVSTVQRSRQTMRSSTSKAMLRPRYTRQASVCERLTCRYR